MFYLQHTTCKGKSQQQESGVIKMCNQDIKEYASKNNVRLWQIANELGVNDGNFSRKLRKEFTEEKKLEVKQIIDKIAMNK